MPIKTCSTCGTEFEYDDPDELLEHFYMKSGYYLNSCKVCERKRVNEKYANGTYVRKGTIESYRYHDLYRIGNNYRCSKRQMSNYKGEEKKRKTIQQYEWEKE